MSVEPGRIAAVVLAGGGSRRFGSDKLAADVGGRPLLEVALDGLPEEAQVAVVGPRRPLRRPVTFVREDPPGGGPAAGLVTGLAWALESGAELMVVLPGDAPGAGRAADLLLSALTALGAGAVVGVDSAGSRQVLQLALRQVAARTLVEAAGQDLGRDQSVHRLLATLTPAPSPVLLTDELTRDIDTVEQMTRFRQT